MIIYIRKENDVWGEIEDEVYELGMDGFWPRHISFPSKFPADLAGAFEFSNGITTDTEGGGGVDAVEVIL